MKHEHNMWAYIYYSIYLETIDTSEHSAIESFIYTLVKRQLAVYGRPHCTVASLYLPPPSFHKLREGHLEFFPLLVSLALEKEEATTAKQLEELKCMMQQLRARFEEVSMRQLENPNQNVAIGGA